MSDIRLTTLQAIFRGWGKLAAAKYNTGSFPSRFSHCVGFIAPILRQMGFSLEVQEELLSSFLQGVNDQFFSIIDEDVA